MSCAEARKIGRARLRDSSMLSELVTEPILTVTFAEVLLRARDDRMNDCKRYREAPCQGA